MFTDLYQIDRKWDIQPNSFLCSICHVCYKFQKRLPNSMLESWKIDATKKWAKIRKWGKSKFCDISVKKVPNMNSTHSVLYIIIIIIIINTISIINKPAQYSWYNNDNEEDNDDGSAKEQEWEIRFRNQSCRRSVYLVRKGLKRVFYY